MGSSSDIRVGILGIGSMGRHHVRNARALDGFDLVAVADPGGTGSGSPVTWRSSRTLTL